MDFLRASVFRRGDSSRDPADDVERQRLPEMGEEQGQETARRHSLGRPQIPSIFSRRWSVSQRPWRRGLAGDDNTSESPKTPRFDLENSNGPSSRPHPSTLYTPATYNSSFYSQEEQGESSASDGNAETRPVLQRASTERSPTVTEPRPVRMRSNSDPVEGHARFRGADPAEVQLADLAETGRRRRHRRRGGHHRARPRAHPHKPPKKFLFCFPWVKSRRTRNQILQCFISGMFLILLLTVYLALSITQNITNSEFTVLLILIILFTTIFFCHGLIRLCMMIVKPTNPDHEREHLPQMMGPGGYAVPRRPIHVIMAQDEEDVEDAPGKRGQPPAYGLWRESVRVDPNRIYWARNHGPAMTGGRSGSAEQPVTGNRPPSYASDDGVEYVVEARPRSIAPLSDVPLPTHPSEAGRVAFPSPR